MNASLPKKSRDHRPAERLTDLHGESLAKRSARQGGERFQVVRRTSRSPADGEVRKVSVPLLVEEHVRRAEIPVDHAPTVSHRQGGGYLLDDPGRVFVRERA